MDKSLLDYNNRNDASFSNKNIREAVHKLITEEELYAHNITSDAQNLTADTFSQTANTKR